MARTRQLALRSVADRYAREKRKRMEMRMYAEGVPLRTVALYVGVSHAQVRRDLLSLGVRLRDQGRPRKVQ